MPEIEISMGYVATVDDDMVAELQKSKWFYKGGYACRNLTVDGRRRQQYLHHVILPPPEGHQITFKDHNGLNCRRDNLKVVTISESRRAARPRQNGSSQYKGVSIRANHRLWRAEIRVEGKLYHIGYFDYEEDAARAYDDWARTHHGPEACLNFPNEPRPDAKAAA